MKSQISAEMMFLAKLAKNAKCLFSVIYKFCFATFASLRETKAIFWSGLNFIYIVLFTLIILSSCNPDDDVETAIRDDYLGTWQCDEFDQNQTFIATFQVQITNHSSDNSKVLIDNFNQLGFGIQAEAIIDNTSITIPQQLVDGNSIIGSGFISNKLKTIELQYNVDDGSGQPESITATYAK